MKSVFHFLVSPKDGKQYVTEKKLETSSLITASSIENAFDVNRVGIVIETPVGYSGSINIGDTVIVHHNIFRDYYSQNGDIKHSKEYLFDGMFIVGENEIFMYNQSNKWEANIDYCIVKPSNQQLIGEVVYSNNNLFIGKRMGFISESEYEMVIQEGKEEVLYYRMKNSDICIEYEEFK